VFFSNDLRKQINHYSHAIHQSSKLRFDVCRKRQSKGLWQFTLHKNTLDYPVILRRKFQNNRRSPTSEMKNRQPQQRQPRTLGFCESHRAPWYEVAWPGSEVGLRTPSTAAWSGWSVLRPHVIGNSRIFT
jgi:hypothetical protein